ncbi:MAG: efflux RND transporter periplasmic adaptor subunit [Patescibacteria group bacterium]
MAKRRKIIIWVIVVLAVAAGGYFYYSKSKKPKTEYATVDVARGNLTQTVSVTGTINPDRKYELAFQTTGKVLEMNVDVGDQITKGQRLAKIDPGTLLSQLRQAEAGVKVQKKTLFNMERRRESFTEAQRDAQRAQIKQAQAGVDIINDQLKETVIYSPIDGVVLKRFANVGDTTFVNAARSTSILTVAEKGDLLIESNIPESDIIKIILGQKATITFDSLAPDDIFETEVTEIDPDSTVIQDVVYYGIKLKLDNLDQKLKSGMSANVEIHSAEQDDVLMIPLRAVQTQGSQKFVEILNPDGATTAKIQIETGLEGDEGMVEVKSGLQAGQKVVTFTKTL